ncbi:MAG: hypothetical protein EPO68_17275 [Planctomycetota bacterium]|nr:MAG: hypothetical protein EPO68_17275 [Planctomycetota bacterium]
MRSNTWIAVGLSLALAALGVLWWTSRGAAPQSAGIAPTMTPAPARAPDVAELEPGAPRSAEAEPSAEAGPPVEPARSAAPAVAGDPRSQKPDLRGGGLNGRVRHAAPLPEPELFDAPPLLQDCGLPARCATGALRLDEDGAIAGVLVEIPMGASERFGSGKDVDVAIDACDPLARRHLVPLGATAVLRNAGAHALDLAVKGEFDVQLAPGASKRFTPEAAGSVHCRDAVHPWIDVELVVIDNRFTALTDEHGRFHIPDLPRGEYGIVFTHPRLGRRVEADVAIGGDVERTLDIVWDPRSKPVGR